MTPSVRTLPLRLDPLPDEALGSWLDACAHRLQATLGDLAIAIGLPTRKPTRTSRPPSQLPRTPDWTVSLHPDEAASIAAASGQPPAAVHHLTLTRFDGHAVHLDTERRRVRYPIWGRTKGSRYCPHCLRETGGRWQLAWRLSWAFACPAHHCLLVDACPRCNRPPRTVDIALRAIPQPGHCAVNTVSAKSGGTARCGADLADAPVLTLEESHPVIETQRILWDAISSGTVNFGIYAADPQPVAFLLTDLAQLGWKVLHQVTADDLAHRLPADVLAAYAEAHASNPMARMPARAPTRAAFVAVTATSVLRSLRIADPDSAIDDLHQLFNGDRPRIHGLSPVLTRVLRPQPRRPAYWRRKDEVTTDRDSAMIDKARLR
jgi:hypothetical protein